MTALDGVIDLFALCILGILCNVLDPRTYQCGPDPNPPKFLQQFHINDDTNNISPEERRKCIRTRGLAYDLIYWFFQTYSVTDNDAERSLTWLTIFIPHIAQVSTEITLYVEAHESSNGSEGSDLHQHILKHEFRQQVVLCFQQQDDIDYELRKRLALNSSDDQRDLNTMTLAYSGPRNLTITKRDNHTYKSMLTFAI